MLVETTAAPAATRPEREWLENHVFSRRPSLAASLQDFLHDGGLRSLPEPMTGSIRLSRQFRDYGYSGYELICDENLSAKFEFAPLQWGGFAIHKCLVDGVVRREVWEIYGEDGLLTSVEPRMDRNILFVDLTDMEPSCVLLSHLYNYLAHEYAQAGFGSARSRQIRIVEEFLRSIPGGESMEAGLKKIEARMLEAEADPVLNWEERQKVIYSIKNERKKLIEAKRRAHRLKWLPSAPKLWGRACLNLFQRISMRPGSNLAGLSYKYTIGLAIWFFHTVRNNIGYSIALAIYGPFTFYFITQPLNPHAMWAVGKVRSAYLETIHTAKMTLGLDDALVATVAASTEADSTEDAQQTPAPRTKPTDQSHRYAQYKPAQGGMLVGTDVPEVDSQDWSDRMSNFKAMQIGLEENMEFAARMGRIEQMETQLNYPMLADTAWQELERYTDRAEKIIASGATGQLAQYLQADIERARDIELYVWDRLLRFILDHPYVVMDLTGEQTYRDYYLGRAFILLRNMTETLSKRHANLKKPADYKKVERLATAFEKTRKDTGSVLKNLSSNSRLFSQKDRFDGRELRSYMKREWEILYLLHMKAQEAANFGLQAYTWSVRNAFWAIQSIYSTKSRELGLLFPLTAGGKLDVSHAPDESVFAEIRQSIEPLYESAFHLINLDYVSLRPELSERLQNDIEFVQRKTVIERLEASLKDREEWMRSLRK